MPTPFIKCRHGATITLSASTEEAAVARDNFKCTEKIKQSLKIMYI